MDGHCHGLVGILLGEVVQADGSAGAPSAPGSGELLDDAHLPGLLQHGDNFALCAGIASLVLDAVDAAQIDVACGDASDGVGRNLEVDGACHAVAREGFVEFHVDGFRLYPTGTNGVVDAAYACAAGGGEVDGHLYGLAEHNASLFEIADGGVVHGEVFGDVDALDGGVDHRACLGIDEHGHDAQLVDVLRELVAAEGEDGAVGLCGTVDDGCLDAVGNA